MANIVENNELIARFMGVDVDCDTTVYKDSKSTLRQYIHNLQKSEGLLFHTSWDWLMPVVAKCEEVKHNTHGVGEWQYGLGNRYNEIYARLNDFDLLGTHEKVVQFINWHNSKPKN